MPEGIDPVSWFDSRLRYVNEVNCEIVAGIVPVNEFNSISLRNCN
jgi:5,10-methylenetetrahydrofolate reductase